MTASNWSAELKGSTKVKQRLKKQKTRIQNPGPMLNDIGIYMKGSIDKNFQQGGRPEAWEPLSETTLEMRKKRYKRGLGGDRPLIDTGQFRATISHEVVKDEVHIGSNLPPARKMHYGDPNNMMFGKFPAPIPERKVIMIQEEDKDNIKKIVTMWVMQ